jgi:hypothetical protein
LLDLIRDVVAVGVFQRTGLQPPIQPRSIRPTRGILAITGSRTTASSIETSVVASDLMPLPYRTNQFV